MFKKLPALALILASLVLTACGGTSENPWLNLKPIQADEKVVVIEFSDFSCPACKGALTASREVRRMDGVHFEYRHFPLDIPGHELSRAAANAYECASEQDYGEKWEIALFENQGKFTKEFFAALPQKYGYSKDGTFDNAAYQACVAESRYAGKIQTSYRTAIGAGANSTPTFVVNGELIRGAGQLVETVKAKLKSQN